MAVGDVTRSVGGHQQSQLWRCLGAYEILKLELRCRSLARVRNLHLCAFSERVPLTVVKLSATHSRVASRVDAVNPHQTAYSAVLYPGAIDHCEPCGQDSDGGGAAVALG